MEAKADGASLGAESPVWGLGSKVWEESCVIREGLVV